MDCGLQKFAKIQKQSQQNDSISIVFPIVFTIKDDAMHDSINENSFILSFCFPCEEKCQTILSYEQHILKGNSFAVCAPLQNCSAACRSNLHLDKNVTYLEIRFHLWSEKCHSLLFGRRRNFRCKWFRSATRIDHNRVDGPDGRGLGVNMGVLN